ncbi:methylamine utilization protein [Paraburkholderia sp. ZP32-5]|uniref:methylamine utilization protein n=1 Tax=Paraburkholderia sp. ZP32-5 TaxID=2883245 RepID=UPI001F324238|nr:methylamine utilization protein [Paraburkholderia sp. ZP32-5]
MFTFPQGQRVAHFAAALTVALSSTHVLAFKAQVRDQNGAPIEDAVVYAVPIDGRLPHTRPAPAMIMQKNKMFMPLVTVVQKGASVDFPNHDDIGHDVYSFSDPQRFELKIYRGASHPVVFDKTGVEVIGCNIHDTMIAYLLVVDTPYFAKTGHDGTATLPDLPRGSYRVLAWNYRQHDLDARSEQTIQTPAAMPVTFSLQLDPR